MMILFPIFIGICAITMIVALVLLIIGEKSTLDEYEKENNAY
jgi:hypothetical protein